MPTKIIGALRFEIGDETFAVVNDSVLTLGKTGTTLASGTLGELTDLVCPQHYNDCQRAKRLGYFDACAGRASESMDAAREVRMEAAERYPLLIRKDRVLTLRGQTIVPTPGPDGSKAVRLLAARPLIFTRGDLEKMLDLAENPTELARDTSVESATADSRCGVRIEDGDLLNGYCALPKGHAGPCKVQVEQ